MEIMQVVLKIIHNNTGNVLYDVALRRVLVNFVAVEKAISVTYSVCVCVCVCIALGIQHAMHTRRIVICGLSGSAIFFPLYFINGTIFEKCF
jgi:hypothetical protein